MTVSPSRKSLLLLLLLCALVFAGVAAAQTMVPPPLSLLLAQSAVALGVLAAWFLTQHSPIPLGGLWCPAQSGWGRLSVLGYVAGTCLVLGLLPDRTSALSSVVGSLKELQGWVAVLLAPLFEEAFFRGALLVALLGFRWPPLGSPRALFAIYLGALVFLGFHLPLDATVWQQAWESGGVPVNLGAFALGLWTGAIVLVDRSLRWAILAHSLANFATPLWGHALRSF